MKEQDINRIAAIEQAILKKYGEETIKNPKSGWSDEKEREYLEQLKIESKKDKEKKPKLEKVEINRFQEDEELFMEEDKRSCPFCNIYSFSIKDDVYMNKYECCFKCYIKHVEGREDSWAEKKKKLLEE